MKLHLHRFFIVLGSAAGLGSGSAAVADNLILNGSFELGAFVGPAYTRIPAGGSSLTDWTIGGDGVDWHNSVQFMFPHSGDLAVDLNLDGVGPTGSISQTFTTIPGEEYALDFWLSGPGQELGLPDPRVVQVEVGGIIQLFDVPASSNTAMFWEEQHLAFIAPTDTTTLTFSSLDGSGFWGPVVDDVSVQAVLVPEGGSFLPGATLAIGALLWLGRRALRSTSDRATRH